MQFRAGTTPSVTVGVAQSPAYEIPGDTVTLPVMDAYGFADLGSRNGSTVNGQPVSQIALGPGDVIRIGDTEIVFQVRT